MKLLDLCNLEGKCLFKVQLYKPSQMCVAYISYFGGWLSFDEKTLDFQLASTTILKLGNLSYTFMSKNARMHIQINIDVT